MQQNQPLTNAEFLTMVQGLQWLIGYRFQDSYEAGERLCWTFWSQKSGEVRWALDLNARSPFVLPIPKGQRLAKSKTKSPAGLFLHAHFVNKHILAVGWAPEMGRVIQVELTEGHQMELRLFRGGANLILKTPNKSLSWAKPQELKPLEWKEDPKTGRDLDTLAKDLLGAVAMAGSGQAPQDLKKLKLEKLRVSISKAKEDLENKSKSIWHELGQWLKEHQSLQVPSEWASYVDPKLNLFENIQAAFEKGKQQKEKAERVRARIAELEVEFAKLESTAEGDLKKSPQRAQPVAKKNEAGRQLRSLTLPSGHQLLVGRSGAENLEILRTSSAWDYWLHLRDHPSAHAVLRRNKNENMDDEVLRQAINTFIRENFRAKIAQKVGESFEVIIAELRHVKAVRGDKLGRVTFAHERTLRHKFK